MVNPDDRTTVDEHCRRDDLLTVRCFHCRSQVPVNFWELVELGYGLRVFRSLRFHCKRCGRRGYPTVRSRRESLPRPSG